jgi:hypothetical protein
MATTTNYSWSTPDDTALVKDGAAAIRSLGTAIDTTVFTNAGAAIAKATVDAKGDLIAGTADNTVARLAVGANDTILVADSSTATGLKWAAPAGGSGLTLVKRDSFSNVANTGTTYDDVFTSTYISYLLVIESIFAATSTDDLQIQFRYAGPTTQTANYYAYSTGINGVGASENTGSSNASSMTIANRTGLSATYAGGGQFFVYNVGNSSQSVGISGQFTEANDGYGYTFYGAGITPRTYTGFLLRSSSTNITGTVSVYGLAKA